MAKNAWRTPYAQDKFFIDLKNISGSLDDRGIIAWREEPEDDGSLDEMVNDVYGAPFVRGHRYWKWMPFMPNSRPGVKIGQIEDENDLEKMKEDGLEKETEAKYQDYEEVKEENEVQKEDSLHKERVENPEEVPEEEVKVQSGLAEDSSVEPQEASSEDTEDETADL